MSENFEKLKRRFLINAIIVSAVCGVSAGVFSACAVLLVLKLCGISINAGYYVLMGIGCAAACGGALFLILRPDNKKVAKKLDEEYCLNERVQTMVECADREGEIITLQREDASERLSKLPPKSRLNELLKLAVIPVLAVAMMFTGIFVPGVPAEGDVPDVPIDVTYRQKVALAQLIENVKDSNLEQSLSAAVVVVLEEFSESLDDIEFESVMKSTVISTVTVIDSLFASANSYVEINTALRKQDKTKDVGSSILKSVTSYKGANITTLEKVNSLSYDGDAVITSYLTAGVKEIREALNETGGLRFGDMATAINEFLAPFDAALDEAGYTEADALHAALSTLSSSLADCSVNATGAWSPAAIWGEVDKAFDVFVKNGTVALSAQMYNCMMDEFVRGRLAAIFGIDLSELPSLDTVIPDDGTNDPFKPEEPDKPNTGGVGPGNSLYGSNDIVYDPVNEEHTAYGNVFQAYFNEMEERINRGDIADELIKIINEYFKNLNTAKDKENN